MKKKILASFALVLCLTLALILQATLPKEDVKAEETSAEEVSESVTNDMIDSNFIGQEQAKMVDGRIMVQGQASIFLEPDYALITLSVVRDAATATEATQLNNEVMESVFQLLDELGIAKEDYFTRNFNVWPRTDYAQDTGQPLITYQVENQLQIKVRALDRIGEIISAVLDRGANSMYNIEYGVDDSSAAYEEAMIEAVDKALAKAQILAKASGQVINETPTILSEGSVNVYNTGRMYEYEAAMAKEAMGATGPVPIASQKVEITAFVEAVYTVK